MSESKGGVSNGGETENCDKTGGSERETLIETTGFIDRKAGW